MEVTKTLFYVLFALHNSLIFCYIDDDFGFDSEQSTKIDSSVKLSTPTSAPVQRLWGIPDSQAVVGTLFVLKIPTDAFIGDIDHYEVVNHGTHTWPNWLELDTQEKMIRGVPSAKDIGEHYLIIRAVGPEAQHKAKDIFSIEVIRPNFDRSWPGTPHVECALNKDPIMLTLLMDTSVEEVKPQEKVTMISNFAGFLGLPYDIFFLHEHVSPVDMLTDATFFMGGVGNVKKSDRHHFAALSWQVGCGDKIWDKFTSIIQRVKHQAKDGTLAEVLQRSVVGWHAKNEFPGFFRSRREVGSGDFLDEDLEDEEDYSEPFSTTSTSRPHRHHHGAEENFNNIDNILSASEVQYHRPSSPLAQDFENIISTPVLIPERPTVIIESTSTVSVEPTRVVETFETISPSTTTDLVTSDTSRDDRNKQVTVPLMISSSEGNNYTDSVSESTFDSSSTSGSSSSHATDPLTDYFTTDTDKMYTNYSSSSSSYPSSVTSSTSRTTEEMEPENRNLKPTIQHRLKKIAATAGKILRYKIPEDTFTDIEDGSTSNLKLVFRQEGKPISDFSWFKYNAQTQEIIALPLEEHVSKWEFEVEATDRDGDSVSDNLELLVQHHKSSRTVNHEFSLHMLIENTRFKSPVDWQLRIVDALVKLYEDKDSNNIIVKRVVQFPSPVIFSWTNDTLPKSYCPREDIEKLLKVISLDGSFPVPDLQKALRPGITIKKITYQGLGQCETKPETPIPPAPIPRENLAPIPRNQIDQINATAGQLLVFTVPEDSFYDPEDGSARNLGMSLLHMDRSPLEPAHWLQFDSKNQEFFGVPMDEDTGRKEYQLVCEDSGGLTANDGLVVVVHPRVKQLYNVEFNLAIDVPYQQLRSNANLKRKFFDKLKELFGDPDTNSIVLGQISPGSTVVTWYNRSLPVDICPGEDILRLRQILINDNQEMSDKLVSIMGNDFPVISAGLESAGYCLGEFTVLHKPELPHPPVEETPVSGPSEDYLVTFVIPAVIIAVMLMLAGIIACLFYLRRRRSNKMGIGDEDERQSFRNKGIPVIFQDELEDKPDQENKNPIIMKEEKPPLPPPEYQRGYESKQESHVNADTPYHPPPPPFTSNRDTGRNTRPKPTPTYRKPPPYVPP